MGIMQDKEATLCLATGTFFFEVTVEVVVEEQVIMEAEEAVEVEEMGTTLTLTLKTPIILLGGERLKNGSSIMN